MENIDGFLQAVFNASATPPVLLVAVAKILAVWVVYGVAIALVWGWLRSGGAARKQLVIVGVTIVIALSINMIIAALWYHPRPFEIGVGNQFLDHAADNSFPSDHASVMFAVAFGLMAARASMLWAGPALLLAFGVAWSRVYLGVHWPLDMAGSFGVALGASWLARIGVATGRGQSLSRWALKLYDRVLDLLHIPASISPRSINAD